MTTPTTFPLATLHLRCVGCSYALRGLEQSGRCPECGTPIEETLARAQRGGLFSRWWRGVVRRWSGPPLDESSPPWLRLTGAGVLMLASTLPLLAVWHTRRHALNYWATVPDYGLVAVFAWFALAVWLLTWPERSTGHAVAASPGLSWRETRWVLRALSPVPALAAVVAVRSEFVSVADHPRWAAAGASLLWVSPVLSFLLFDYLAYLAARVPAFGTAGVLRLILCMASVPTTLVALGPAMRYGEVRRVPELVDGTMHAVLWGCTPISTLLYVGTFVLLAALGLRIWFVQRAAKPASWTTSSSRSTSPSSKPSSSAS